MIVGLTGGIGSGKSEVSKRFEALDINVVDADIVARKVVAPNQPVLKNITEHFGQHILGIDGSLDRAQLRNIIFSTPSEKIWLENLLHPIIRAEIIQQLLAHSSPYAILSSPLLFETKQNELVNRVLVVDTEENLQIERATQRDNNSTEHIQRIMSTQLTRAERCAKANDIIHNVSDLNKLTQQVQQLHTYYLSLTVRT